MLTHSQAVKALWKDGAAHAQGDALIALYAMNIETNHGGKAKTYYAHLQTKPEPRERMLELMRDRAKAWDVLMGIES